MSSVLLLLSSSRGNQFKQCIAVLLLFSMLNGPSGTGCDVPVHGCWDSRDVIVAAMFDFFKECMGFVRHFII